MAKKNNNHRHRFITPENGSKIFYIVNASMVAFC